MTAGLALFARARVPGAARRHRWFLGVISLGAVLRIVTMLGYRPAIWFPDSYTYVVTALRPRPDLVRPAGYSMFLRLLEPFHSFGLVVFLQHLLGLATVVLVYTAVLRLGGRGWAATLAAAPVALDAYQIQLEHLLVSDTLFAFLVVAAVFTCLGPLTWRGACAAGLLLAAATLTRTIGLPLIVVVAAWSFFRQMRAARGSGSASAGGRARFGSRSKAGLVGVLVLVALLPVAGYAAWFASTYHRFGIVGSNGVFLYARTMSFADCRVMRPPADLAVLCDPTPPERRPPSQEYVWDAGSPLVALPGITFTRETERLAGRFAFLALRSQPVDYVASVLSELSRSFTLGRPVYPDQEIYDAYEFPAVTPPPPTRSPAMAGAELAVRYEEGPIGTRIVEPFAGWTRAYQDVARVPGTVLLLVLLLPPVVAVVRRRRGERAGPPWTLPWAVSVSLLVVPAATAEFDYRYVLPAVPLACLAAALMTARQADQSEAPRPVESVNIQ
ncbi:hypothetical protein GCM10022226_59430 [Sphaerisporangium flaviroseum]|uniref:Phospholipid carrier-dependent glycosyltransferase n=1 Tax=Sphaerisporangium flaviroseum TaxID=509199 RepID=A0ABP7IZ59_9ACTN